MKQSTWFKM